MLRLELTSSSASGKSGSYRSIALPTQLQVHRLYDTNKAIQLGRWKIIRMKTINTK